MEGGEPAQPVTLLGGLAGSYFAQDLVEYTRGFGSRWRPGHVVDVGTHQMRVRDRQTGQVRKLHGRRLLRYDPLPLGGDHGDPAPVVRRALPAGGAGADLHGLAAEVGPVELRIVYSGPVDLRAVEKPRQRLVLLSYRAFVREHSCISCGRSDLRTDAHHGGQDRGVGQKADDTTCVPLCRWCHRHYHDIGVLPERSAAQTELLILQAQVWLLSEFTGRTMELLTPSPLRAVSQADQRFVDLLDEAEVVYAVA